MKIKINNWEKYNPRKDVKRPSWFPLSIDWVLDPTFYSFTHCERLAWIYLLSTAKKESNPEISVNFDHAVKAANIPENELKSSIEKLKGLGVVTVCTSRGRHADVTRTSRTRHATLQYSTLQYIEPKGSCDLAITTAPRINANALKLLECWNANCGALPKAKALNASRSRTVLARLKENPDFEVWAKAARVISNSKFHTGQNERGWVADFDYFIRPATLLKAMEGSINSTDHKPKNNWKPVNDTSRRDRNT